MTQSRSLQRRLGLGLTLGVGLWWLMATTATVLIVDYTLNKALDSALEEVAQRILSLAVVEILNRDAPDLLQQVVPLRKHDEYITYFVRSVDGTPLLKSHRADTSVFPDKPQLGLRSTETHRLYGISAVSDTLFIEVAEPLAARHRARWRVILLLQLPLLVLMPLGLLAIWWFVGDSLRGLLAYRDAIKARGAEDLSLVEGSCLPKEMVPIADAVNQLLTRLRRTLETERSFAANSAHELRTPLAAALAQVQRLQREAPPGLIHDRAGRIEEALRTLSRLSEKLLQLARAESGGILLAEAQDIIPVLRYVADEFKPSAGSRLRLMLPNAGILHSRIDPDVLSIIIRNLIENALKHGADDQPVCLCLSTDGVLRVVNNGAIVPPDELIHLTDRFVRSNTRANGSGLGLSIAQTIALRAGRTLTLTSPAPGHEDGFEVSLLLP